MSGDYGRDFIFLPAGICADKSEDSSHVTGLRDYIPRLGIK